MSDKPSHICDNCAKRGPWRHEVWGKSMGIIADCNQRPLPPFWRDYGNVQVTPGCGSECRSWEPVIEKDAP